MKSDASEWLFNAILVLAIGALIALIGMQRFSRPKLAPPVSHIAQANQDGETDDQDKPAALSGDAAFPYLGKTDPFRAIYTPPPPPPTKTPKPPPTPNLDQALNGWTLQYPWRQKGQPTRWVFAGKRKGEEHQITEGQPYSVKDGRNTFDITAKPGDDRYSVILYYENQERKFSLLD